MAAAIEGTTTSTIRDFDAAPCMRAVSRVTVTETYQARRNPCRHIPLAKYQSGPKTIAAALNTMRNRCVGFSKLRCGSLYPPASSIGAKIDCHFADSGFSSGSVVGGEDAGGAPAFCCAALAELGMPPMMGRGGRGTIVALGREEEPGSGGGVVIGLLTTASGGAFCCESGNNPRTDPAECQRLPSAEISIMGVSLPTVTSPRT